MEDYLCSHGGRRTKIGSHASSNTRWRRNHYFISIGDLIHFSGEPLVTLKKLNKIMKAGKVHKVFKAAGIAKKRKKKNGNI